MADEINNDPALVAELDKIKRDYNSALTDLSGVRDKLKEVNAESKGHRLNADNFRRQAEENKAQAEELAAKVAKLAEDQDTALKAIRTEHQTALEATRTELTAKATEAEGKVSEALTKAQQRVLQAGLKVAATNAGVVDLDALKLLDVGKAELTEDGELKNGAELMAALKEAKPYLFTEPPKIPAPGNTGTTEPPPKPKTPETKRATEMSQEEYRAAKRNLIATAR